MNKFKQELEKLINKHSVENESNTPDYILANFISGCLKAYADAVNSRDASSKRKEENKVILHNIHYKLIPIFDDWEINLICRTGIDLCPMGHNGKTLPNGHTIMGVRVGKRNYQLGDWLPDGKITRFILVDNGRIKVELVSDDKGVRFYIDLAELA